MPSKRPKLQFAALPFRTAYGGLPEVLLITSRDTGRWIIPKGWPMKGRKPWEAAAQEAWEEAGVLGRTTKKTLGHFDYDKVLPDRPPVRCRVKVFALSVEMADAAWPEYGQRRRRWFRPSDAATLVGEADLAAIILAFETNWAKSSKDEGTRYPAEDPLSRRPMIVLDRTG